ncbi:hypothetical protein THAOC_09966 [Thalassiosira oceanica]|uniref:Uncharacterized protein n=1 Tax=Thalassiosira oceanica TaxID=159749 RepID=K0TE33_THAOC|nr:hypothetical protein THAOC_09966 [Thalassiosira oceanica]|eukprot:EJK68822.1 hypothetical protein THAOC_09966 [Thalassiosira oceanica]
MARSGEIRNMSEEALKLIDEVHQSIGHTIGDDEKSDNHIRTAVFALTAEAIQQCRDSLSYSTLTSHNDYNYIGRSSEGHNLTKTQGLLKDEGGDNDGLPKVAEHHLGDDDSHVADRSDGDDAESIEEEEKDENKSSASREEDPTSTNPAQKTFHDAVPSPSKAKPTPVGGAEEEQRPAKKKTERNDWTVGKPKAAVVDLDIAQVRPSRLRRKPPGRGPDGPLASDSDEEYRPDSEGRQNASSSKSARQRQKKSSAKSAKPNNSGLSSGDSDKKKKATPSTQKSKKTPAARISKTSLQNYFGKAEVGDRKVKGEASKLVKSNSNTSSGAHEGWTQLFQSKKEQSSGKKRKIVPVESDSQRTKKKRKTSKVENQVRVRGRNSLANSGERPRGNSPGRYNPKVCEKLESQGLLKITRAPLDTVRRALRVHYGDNTAAADKVFEGIVAQRQYQSSAYSKNQDKRKATNGIHWDDCSATCEKRASFMKATLMNVGCALYGDHEFIDIEDEGCEVIISFKSVHGYSGVPAGDWQSIVIEKNSRDTIHGLDLYAEDSEIFKLVAFLPLSFPMQGLRIQRDISPRIEIFLILAISPKPAIQSPLNLAEMKSTCRKTQDQGSKVSFLGGGCKK